MTTINVGDPTMSLQKLLAHTHRGEAVFLLENGSIIARLEPTIAGANNEADDEWRWRGAFAPETPAESLPNFTVDAGSSLLERRPMETTGFWRHDNDDTNE